MNLKLQSNVDRSEAERVYRKKKKLYGTHNRNTNLNLCTEKRIIN